MSTPVAVGTLVKIKQSANSYAETGVISIAPLPDDGATGQYLISTAIDGTLWLFRDQFTLMPRIAKS